MDNLDKYWNRTSNWNLYNTRNNWTANNNSNNWTVTDIKKTYTVLGEKIKLIKNDTTGIIITNINLMGKKYYDELKKQDVEIPSELKTLLDEKIIQLERNYKLNKII